MASKLKRLQDRKAALITAMRQLSDAAEKDERSLSDEEQAQYDGHLKELPVVDEELKREQELQQLERDLIGSGDAGQAADRYDCEPTRAAKAAHIGNARPSYEDDSKGGFRDHREMLRCVMEAGRTGRVDPRLARFIAPPKETAGSDEASTFSDPYGGFLIPRGFIANLLTVDPELDPIAGRTTNVPMDVAVIDIPARVDKNHTSSVSGGLRVYRRAEGDTSASSRMEFEQVSLRAHALFGISYATEELLARSPMSFIALLEAGFRDEFGSKLVDERLTGSGVGMYEGVLTCPAKISVTKETGQAADTIVYENVIKMRARCWRYSQAIWLANHDTLPQLMLLNQAVGTGGVPVWQPSAREGEPEMLLGRPIFFTEHCDTLGDESDILLGNWSQYLEGELTPIQGAESIHVRFINHERTFKFWVENDGRCWWRAALTPKNGAATLSPFVTLAARA